MKILTVDDDASVRQALSVGLQLQSQDLEVLEAADGETGPEALLEQAPTWSCSR